LKLYIKILLIIFSHFGICETILPTEELQHEKELLWDSQFQSGKLKINSNYILTNSSNKFYTRYFREYNKFSYGFRIGDYINQSTPAIERYFFKLNYSTLLVQIGDYKINTGKGLSFGSEYGSSFQVESVNQLAKNNWGFKPNLSSVISNNSKAFLIGLNYLKISSYLLSFDRFNTNYFFIKSDFSPLIVNIIMPLITNRIAINTQFKNNYFNINSEILDQSIILSLLKKGTSIDFFFHYRHYQPNFTSFKGKHFHRLNVEIGETGIISSLTRKLKNMKYSIGLEIYKPTIFAEYNEKYVRSQFYFYLITKNYPNNIGFDWEQRFFNEQEEYIENGLIFNENQHTSMNRLGMFTKLKNNILFKFQAVQIINDDSYKFSYSYSVRKKDINFYLIKINLGMTKFNVPDWSLRTYDYEPGLPGEFRLKSRNGVGVSLFSVITFNVSNESKLHFRISVAKENKEKIKSEFGMQLNIGY
jgi:hypothetical protein